MEALSKQLSANEFALINSLPNLYETHSSYKSITRIKQVIILATDKNSLKESSNLVKDLLKLQKNCLIIKQDIKTDLLEKQLDNINANRIKIESLLKFIDDFTTDGESEVKIDDKNMIGFIANMTNAKEILTYMSDFIAFVLEIQKSNSGKLKKYSFDSLVESLKAA